MMLISSLATQGQNKGTSSIILLLVILAFFLGMYLGSTIGHVNPEERIAQIVSCKGYEEDFLKEIGFQNRESCVELNTALHKQYIDDCLAEIESSGDASNDKKLIDLCVYHMFEKEAISLSSKYTAYRKKQSNE